MVNLSNMRVDVKDVDLFKATTECLFYFMRYAGERDKQRVNEIFQKYGYEDYLAVKE